MTLHLDGFLVIPACNGEEAIELFRSGIAVDVLLTDMQMGNGITGIALAEHLLHQRPGIAVLLMSGFPDAKLLANERNLPFLEEPFTPDMLVKRLRQVLASRGSAQSEIPT